MKIRFLSKYDVAKNFIKIIRDSAQYSQEKKVTHDVSELNKQICNSSLTKTARDTFVKTTEKAAQK